MNQSETVRQAADQLAGVTQRHEVVVGFDGFIDEIIHLVDERIDKDHFKRIERMEALAQRIGAAAGLSCNIEMVTTMTKLGGNGPIMANALATLGHGVTYIGAIGRDGIHPVFQDFAAHCRRVISLTEPAHTDALEFHNGKIMMGKMASLAEVNWDRLLAVIPAADLKALLTQSALVACVNWTMIPNMNSIFRGVASLLKGARPAGAVFVDLTDPRKRRTEDIAEALGLLTAMQEVVDVMLGMNEGESRQVADVLGLGGGSDLAHRADMIRERLQLKLAVIHPTSSAYAATASGVDHVFGPFTDKPKLTTGAGDVFNSGFCHGLLSGLAPLGALCTGVGASGFYVRQCRSASATELTDFMRAWAAADCGPI